MHQKTNQLKPWLQNRGTDRSMGNMYKIQDQEKIKIVYFDLSENMYKKKEMSSKLTCQKIVPYINHKASIPYPYLKPPFAFKCGHPASKYNL